MTSEAFFLHGCQLTRHPPNGSLVVRMRRFREMFGTSPKCCHQVWELSRTTQPSNTTPTHLLWALMFFNSYSTESEYHALTGADEKTFRKWCWTWVNMISELDCINWDNRFDNAHPEATLFVSLDGTDFRIREPSEFDPCWYSHKFHGPGLRYEIGICIATGWIVWAHGGVPCGSWPDLRLARDAFCSFVGPNEMTLADRGYCDPRYFIYPRPGRDDVRRQKEVMARHETCNRRLKQFRVLGGVFRHQLYLHPICFHAVVNLTQLMIELGEELYSVM
ncbi:hypothetical protein Ae201684_005301 [Aphanomyces euteiches]|uniref:DDE Tnp4 domain-containing protein n=1 Tax=Aphanomyces euteiches TaxID=100861 RepID=A0A6G0XFV5_9STRA|nr:hypothetical protein Ae201684_005301 [Aphanomyces euteiches]